MGPVKLPIVQIDAFADRVFEGNPAAVVVLPDWLPDPVLGAIAAENNLSETAFLVAAGGRWRLRWFTPTVEVELCGHATLAAGAVVLADGGDEARFDTASGELVVRRDGDDLALSLPSLRPRPASAVPAGLEDALGAAPTAWWSVKAVHRATYWLATFPSAAAIVGLAPDTRRLGRDLRSNVICTAPGDAGTGFDFVSRFFAPGSGVDEDPVTGSAHATLAPFWAERLASPAGSTLIGRQLSRRGGTVRCRLEGAGAAERVWLAGRCARYLEGTITVPA